MASPFVAGVAALLLQKKGDLTASEIKSILRSTASTDSFTGSVWNRKFGDGKVDAQAAVPVDPDAAAPAAPAAAVPVDPDAAVPVALAADVSAVPAAAVPVALAAGVSAVPAAVAPVVPVAVAEIGAVTVAADATVASRASSSSA